MADPSRLDYSFLVAHFHTESDAVVLPIEPTAVNMAALIFNVGCCSDVGFYAPDGTEVAVSDYDNGIAQCFDRGFMREELVPTLERMIQTQEVPEVAEAEVDPAVWADLYEQYYDGPNVDGPDDLIY